MKTATLSLAVLAVLALAASTTLAAAPVGVHVAATAVAHHGHGFHHGHGVHHRHHAPVPIRRPLHVYPRVVPGPRCGLVAPYPVYRTYRYYPRAYYYPGASITYRGSGFGFSIGF